jgi:hypothetical protein
MLLPPFFKKGTDYYGVIIRNYNLKKEVRDDGAKTFCVPQRRQFVPTLFVSSSFVSFD